MNILVDGQTLESAELNRGIGVYFKNVLNNMVKGSYEHNWFITVSHPESIKHLDPWVSKRVKAIVNPIFAPGFDYERTTALTKTLRSTVVNFNIDVMWLPNPLMVNVLFPNESIGCPFYLTVHDLIPAVMSVPGWSKQVKKEYFSRFDTIRTVPNMHIICISQSTKNDVTKLISADVDTRTIAEAADSQLFYKRRERGGINDEPYILFTGGFDYRKNIDGAVNAFAAAVKKHSDDPVLAKVKFYIVCNCEEAQKISFYEKIANMDLCGRIELTGYVSDEKLASLYQNADVFFFPSLYEGFGLPLLEAMLGGAYVLSADNSSLPEVCDGHGLLCNANDIDNMAEKIVIALQTASRETAQEKQERQQYALTFSWEKAASETLAYMSGGGYETILPQEKMKLAIVTPWPYHKTGIANYIYKIIPFLSDFFDVDIFVDNIHDSKTGWAPNLWGGLYLIGELKNRHGQYQHILYQFGNSAQHHCGIYEAAMQYPGIAEIHDFILHHFFYHAYHLNGDSKIYANALEKGYGPAGIAQYQRVCQGAPPDDVRFPMTHSISCIGYATIFHNVWSAEQMKSKRQIHVIPHASFEKEDIQLEKAVMLETQIKSSINLKEDEFLIGCMGFVNENKRPVQIISAISKLIHKGYRVRLAFFGKSNFDGLNKIIRKKKLQDYVVVTGYINKAEYETGLAMCNVIVNLRYPSMGESSGTLCEAFRYAKPVLVSEVNQYTEFPDDICWKVPVDQYEVPVLESMLEYLINHTDVCVALGENARRYAESVLAPDRIAKAYYDILMKITEAGDV